MRQAIIALCGVQLLGFLFILYSAFPLTSDAAGNGMTMGFLTIGGVVMAIFVVPALILAFTNRALVFSLILSLAFPAVAAYGILSGLL